MLALMFTLLWLAVGFVLGAVYVSYARSRRSDTKRVFGMGLLIAALIYLAFVFRASDPLFWAVVETAGVVLFGLLGSLGFKGSDWWLVAGWAVHPVWDLGLHYVGPGGAFVPAWFAIACVSFDLLVAAYIALAAFRRANPSM